MMRWLLLLLWSVGCRDTYVLPAGHGNASPLAQAGTGSTVRIDTTNELDGSRSFDPDGELVAYTWELRATPPGSAAVVSSTATAWSSFVADVAGTYRIRLTVRDDAGALAYDEVTFEATPPPVTEVTVDAGPDVTIEWIARAQLAGTVSATNGFTPTYAWTMISRPFYSTATLEDATALTPSFVADAQGAYTLRLSATADGVTATDDVVVTVSTVGRSFGAPAFAEPVAVAYSNALDRLVVLRGYSSPALSLVDPATGLGPTLTLPVQTGLSVVLDPSGLRAAVGTPSEIVIVDLQTLSVEDVFDAATDNYRLVFGPDNRVHSIPERTTANIVTVDLATGLTQEVPSFGTFPGAAMHPGGAAMYVVDGGTSTIARYDIASRPIALQRQASSPSALIGPLLAFTSDGASIITGPGTVLRSSTSAAIDMTVLGSLPMTMYMESAAHSSVRHEIVTVSSGSMGPRRLYGYDDATFARRFTAAFVDPLTLNDYWNGFVAYRADGARLYIIGRYSSQWTVFTVTPPP